MSHTSASTRPTAPIGIFDSGVGGLTVVRELAHQLPHESIVYYGDTARVPYGSKSPATVCRYSGEILEFLLGQGVKAVVVACNTATAHALAAMRERSPVPVLGVIQPGARAAAAATRTRRIGVIGTVGTIRSRAYEHAIAAVAPDAEVIARACPLFVPLIEEGWSDTEVAYLVAREYLAPIAHTGADTVVLGCTHYPLMKRVIGEVIGRPVRLVDSGAETAAETARLLSAAGLLAPDGTPQRRFVVSDDPAPFLALARRFLGTAAVDGVEHAALG